YKGKLRNNASLNGPITIAHCANLTTIDFSQITDAPYQTSIFIGYMFSISNPSFAYSKLQKISFNGSIPIFNWNFNYTDFSTNNIYTTCIEVSSLSDVSYCEGSNEWPDDVTYSTNCNTPIDCQLSTSVVETYLQNKKFLKVTNLLGKETKVKNNEPLLYLYDDGTVEKRITIE
ncbi:MAG: hypothetical protein CMD03_01915, partial [Flavobacteriales bacterium]|nr:hypothetical protein [Flavobacteriales bacterium]